MDRLELSARPPTDTLMFDTTCGLVMTSLIAVAFMTIMAVAAPDRIIKSLASAGVVIFAFALLVTLPLFLNGWRYRRSYPQRLREFLDSSLSPDDYERLDRIARRHPEVKPWIQELMGGDGQLRYREAEQLQARINDYLAALPQQQLAATLRQP